MKNRSFYKVKLALITMPLIVTTIGCAQQPAQNDSTAQASNPAQSVAKKVSSTGKPEATVRVENAPFLGKEDAPITIVEFVDYECGQCGRHAGDGLKGIVKDFVDTGKVKYVMRDYPGEKFHKKAFKAAEATHCAGDQDKYWEMHDRLLANQNALAESDLPSHAAALGIDPSDFSECLASGKYVERIRQDIAEGDRIGLTGTPYLIYGLTEPGSSTVTGQVVPGASEYIVWKNRLNTLLAPSLQK